MKQLTEMQLLHLCGRMYEAGLQHGFKEGTKDESAYMRLSFRQEADLNDLINKEIGKL